jgi:hypothetical protein
MAMYTKATDVKKAFIRNGLPFFIIKGKGGDTLYYNGIVDDIDEAADNIESFCNNIEDTNELKIYQFATVPKTGITKAKPEDGVLITYQNKKTYSNDEKVEYWRNKAVGGGGSQTDPALIAILSEMREDNKALRAEMAEIRRLQTELDESDDDDDIRNESQSGLLGMLGNPTIQNVLVSLFTNLGANMAANTMAAKQPRGMAGVADDAELMQYVEKLISKGVTVEHLKKLSELPALKIKSLLMML